jgi:hypothetical protein
VYMTNQNLLVLDPPQKGREGLEFHSPSHKAVVKL